MSQDILNSHASTSSLSPCKPIHVPRRTCHPKRSPASCYYIFLIFHQNPATESDNGTKPPQTTNKSTTNRTSTNNDDHQTPAAVSTQPNTQNPRNHSNSSTIRRTTKPLHHLKVLPCRSQETNSRATPLLSATKKSKAKQGEMEFGCVQGIGEKQSEMSERREWGNG
ncbi:hypothetical protein Droror1_Dr00011061 [Drosera rotundifolia]